jgi:hypothetical protein
MTTLVGFIIWIVFGVAVGIRATHRGRNAWGWLFISILISPLLAAIRCSSCRYTTAGPNG